MEKLQILRGLMDGEDGSVAVDLPNLGAQRVIMFSLPVHIWEEIYRNKTLVSFCTFPHVAEDVTHLHTCQANTPLLS